MDAAERDLARDDLLRLAPWSSSSRCSPPGASAPRGTRGERAGSTSSSPRTRATAPTSSRSSARGSRWAPAGSSRGRAVQLYAYLLDADADAVGFTRPAWSLSSASEVGFQDRDPAQYRLFGVHYLILPRKGDPPIPATLVDRKGSHALWTVGNGGYFQVVDTRGTIVADRTDLGAKTAEFMRSDEVRRRLFPTIAFPGAPAAPATDPRGTPRHSHAGRIVFETDQPADGVFTARVAAERRSMVLLSASFDNRWTVTVDGQERPTQMVAPSLVGRNVPAGRHTVEFPYKSFPAYGWLLGLSALSLLSLAVGQRGWRRRERPTRI